MDKFVVRESRVAADFPQMIPFSPSASSNNNIGPDTMYLGGYGAEFPLQQSPGFMPMTHVNAAPYPPNFGNQGPMMSGYDPRMFAAAAFMAGQKQPMTPAQNTMAPNGPAFPSDYENRTFIGADRNRPKTFPSQMTASSSGHSPRENLAKYQAPSTSTMKTIQSNRLDSQPKTQKAPGAITTKPPSKEIEVLKNEMTFSTKTRAEKFRDLHKSGIRVYSGPVEKVFKWHKSLQDLGLLVIYEIVGKCVSIRPGESCARNLVVRDDSGPAIQVVYYEIDFLLPELRPPCTVRVVGRMMPGTCRLQAFSVRAASGDDVSTLQRRAAVAAHHVAKLCKEYAIHN